MQDSILEIVEPILVIDDNHTIVLTNAYYTRTLNLIDSERFQMYLSDIGMKGAKRLLNLVKDVEETQIFKGSNEKTKKSILETILNRQLKGLENSQRAKVIYLFMEIVFGFHKYQPIVSGFYYKCGSSDLSEFIVRVIMTLKAFSEEMTAAAPVFFNEMKAETNDFGFRTRNAYIEEYYRLEYRSYHEMDLILARFREATKVWSYGLHAGHCATPDPGCVANELNKQINKNKKQEKEDDKMREQTVELLAEGYAVVKVKFVSGPGEYEYFVPTDLLPLISTKEQTMVIVPKSTYCRVPQLALVVDLIERPNKNTKARKFILDVVNSEAIETATKRNEEAIAVAEKQVEIYQELNNRFEQASKLSLWEQAAQNDPKMKELLDQLKAIGGK